MSKINQHVDLDGYSNSIGFRGHFERVVPLSIDVSRLATEIISGFYGEGFRDLRVVVSMLFRGEALNSAIGLQGGEDARRDIYDLWMAGLVEKDDSHFEGGGLDKPLVHFKEYLVSDVGISMTKKLMNAIMFSGGLRGHCFLLDEQGGVILYPHDDTGFGIISFNDRAGIAASILKCAAGHPEFSVV